MNLDVVGQVAIFAAIALALVDHFYRPVIRFLEARIGTSPSAGLQLAVDVLNFAEQYVQAIVAGLLCWFARINLFPDLPGVLGIVLTALIALFAQDIVVSVREWPRRLAQEQYISALALEMDKADLGKD